MERIRRGSPGKPPLVLVHDGGGTTASYHSLKDLDHDIYGIENPLFHAGKPWKGGIPAMARSYCALVNLELGRTSIVLGWSFGGLVALEMVEILNYEYSIDVKGVLLLDSVCPSWKPRAALSDDFIASTTSTPSFSSRLLVRDMMKQSALMAEQWHAPQWRSMVSDSQRLDCCCAGFLHPSKVVETSFQHGPLVILIRCLGRLRSGDEASARVDVSRECETLGWEHVRPGLVSYTLQTSANHFNLFTKGYVHETTEKVGEALRIIEAIMANFDITSSTPPPLRSISP